MTLSLLHYFRTTFYFSFFVCFVVARLLGTTDGPRSALDLKRPPTSPGEMLLEEFLRPADLTQVEAARRMKIPLNRLNEIIHGKRGITADTALRLARLLEMSPEFWMSLQADWDLWHAAHTLRKAG